MKKTFKMGLVLVLILSVFCACNPEGPAPEKPGEDTVTPGSSSISVTLQPYEGAEKYVVRLTNDEDVTVTDTSKTVTFESKAGINYQLGVSAYAADGKLVATGSQMVTAEAGAKSVTVTMNAVTERVLSRITTSVAFTEGPSAGAVEECLILNNDGTFTRSKADVMVTVGGDEQVTSLLAAPEGESGSSSIKLVPSFDTLNTEGTYKEEDGSIILTATDGTSETVTAADYEVLEGKPFGDDLTDGLLSLGSIAVKAEDLDALAKQGAQMGVVALNDNYALPSSIQKIVAAGTVLAQVNKDLVLDLYLQLRPTSTKVYAVLHFEGEKTDPILSVLNGSVSLRDPLAVKAEAELPFFYEEGHINLGEGAEHFPLAIEQKAGNTVVVANFQIPLQGGGAVDLSVPLRRVDWKPWRSGTAFKEAKSFAPKSIEFKKIYDAIMNFAGDSSVEGNTAPADLDKYLKLLTSINWTYDGEHSYDLTGSYTCTDSAHANLNFVISRPAYMEVNGKDVQGGWKMTAEGTYAVPPVLKYTNEQGNTEYVINSFVTDPGSPEKVTALDVTFNFTSYNPSTENETINNLVFKKTESDVSLPDDFLKSASTVPEKVILGTDGSIIIHGVGHNGEVFEKNTGLKYKHNSDTFFVSADTKAINNLVNGGRPDSSFALPFPVSVYVNLPYSSNGSAIAPFQDADGNAFGAKLI